MARILIVDDYPPLASALGETITGLGHGVEISNSISGAVSLAERLPFDLIFLDICLPDGSGLDFMPHLRHTRGRPDIIIMTASKDIQGANLALENGAWDYLCKPFDLKEARVQAERVLQYRTQTRVPEVSRTLKQEGIIGTSPQLQMSLDKVAQAASTMVNTLITGETGTGKELFSRAIHDNSAQSDHPFVVLDCSVLPDHLVETTLFGHEKGAFTGAEKTKQGLIELADKGTLFVDEIGDLSLESQKIFLRVLQEKSYRPVGSSKEVKSDFRLVSATNRDLEQLVQEKKFRKDLLFRLKGFSIHLPPLRERNMDIKALTFFHLGKICAENNIETKGVSPDFIQSLELYDWPGNVRELVHTIDRAVAAASLSPVLFPVHLPGKVRVQTLVEKRPAAGAIQPVAFGPTTDLPLLKEARNQAVSQFESDYLKSLYTLSGDDVKTACRISGLKRTRLWQLYKKYGIKNHSLS